MTVAHFPASGITRDQAGGLLRPGVPAGAYQWSLPGGQAATMPGADLLIGHLFPMPIPRTLARLHMRVRTGGAGSAVKWGVWPVANGRATGLPLFAQNTGLSTATSDTLLTQDVTDTLLAAPWYAFGAVFTGTLPTMTGQAAITFNGDVMTYVGFLGATGLGVNPTGGFTVSQTYANDIGALDLTSASLAPLVSGNVPGVILEFV